MKNLLFVAVLLLTVSGFAMNPMPECGDGDTRSTVSSTQLYSGTIRLIQVGAAGNNQQNEISKLRDIIGKSELTHIQDLALQALAGGEKNLRFIRVQNSVCPSERASSLDQVQTAEGVILNVRGLLAAQAKAAAK